MKSMGFGKYTVAALFVPFLLFAIDALAQHEQHKGAKFEHDPSHGMADLSDEDRLNVAVFLYDGALVLDYGVAAEMFLAADYMRAFNVYTVSEEGRATVSLLGETITDFTFEDAPQADVVIVPGGPLWTQAGQDADVIEFLGVQREKGATLFSICTGGMLLAQAGFWKTARRQQSISPIT